MSWSSLMVQNHLKKNGGMFLFSKNAAIFVLKPTPQKRWGCIFFRLHSFILDCSMFCYTWNCRLVKIHRSNRVERDVQPQTKWWPSDPILSKHALVGGFKDFLCSPLFGEDCPIWLIFFRWGWNHQLESYSMCSASALNRWLTALPTKYHWFLFPGCLWRPNFGSPLI